MHYMGGSSSLVTIPSRKERQSRSSRRKNLSEIALATARASEKTHKKRTAEKQETRQPTQAGKDREVENCEEKKRNFPKLAEAFLKESPHAAGGKSWNFLDHSSPFERTKTI